MYYKLKTSFLEETLSDALDEDSFDLSILESSSQTDTRLSSSFSEISTPDVSALTNENSIILPVMPANNSGCSSGSIDVLPNSSAMAPSSGYYESRCSQEFEAEITHNANENAWKDIPKHSTTANGSGNNSNTLRKSLSNKLFRNSSFLMRNPRKSLSKGSLTSNSQSSQSSSQVSQRKDSFPDLETILSQKSKQQHKENDVDEEQLQSQPNDATSLDVKTIGIPATSTAAAPPLATMAMNSVKHLDNAWLKRCHQANSMASDEHEPMNHSLVESNEFVHTKPTIASDKPRVFGISNINAAALAKFEQKQLLESPDVGVGAKSMLSFDMGNLNLMARNSFDGSAAMNLDMLHDVDDDEIANSEDESELNTSRQIRSIRGSTKRRRSEIDEHSIAPPVKSKPAQNVRNDMSLNDQTATNDKLQQDDAGAVPARAPAIVQKTKSKTKSKPKVLETKAQIEVVQRRSSRNVNKVTTYQERIVSDSKLDEKGHADDEDDVDPFAGDDSDEDPNFAIPQSPKSRRPIVDSSDTDSECSDTEKPKEVKKEVAAKAIKQRVSRVKKATLTAGTSNGTAKQRTSTGTRKITGPRAVRKKNEPIKTDASDGTAPIDENSTAPTETPDDYLIEFGMENISSVPRIPVAELQQSTLEFSKYICNTSTTAPVEPIKPATVTKHSMAREKLESKVAAGSLNDNYVRLNLRKKVFVRGKKTMNFSRYKKKLWKSKKVAALAGPDMDMGGCDGGTLKCFQCGMPGHFAQNCKVKSK